MEFKKYGSIENSYRQKHIDRFTTYNDFSKILFAALEKIHGANFQIKVSPDGEYKCGTRNKFLSPDENFYEWQKAVSKVNLQPVINYAKKNGDEITLFAELHGKGIQKGIVYQDEKLLRFIDIEVNGKTQDFNTFRTFMYMFRLDMAPVIGVDLKLEEALAIDVETLKSKIAVDASDDNIAEGIVIRPMYKEIYYGDSRFILKQKSSKFAEKQGRKKTKTKEVDPVVIEWNERVLQYVTEARMQNLYSKEGVIQEPKQIGHYIGLYMSDMMEDFLKDYPEFKELELDKKQKKAIMNVSSHIVKILHNDM